MGDLIRPSKVHIITKDGECKLNITIDLNINLNNGNVAVNKSNQVVAQEDNDDDEKTIWAIPEFKSEKKVKFGKRKEQE